MSDTDLDIPPAADPSLALSEDQRRWHDAACAKIDPERLRGLIVDLVRHHSPTGAERDATLFMADHFQALGLKTDYQPVTERSGTCAARLSGAGDGPTLLLYAPIDTHLDADPQKDLPWAGRELRDDMRPSPQVIGETVIGLGANNPKAMLATLAEALRAVIEAGVPLKGDVVIATAGGGMPWIAADRENVGLSSGVRHLLAQGLGADFGIIFKPWDEVYHEHPGLCWFKVSVRTAMGYAGISRDVPGFASSIVPAGRLIARIEDWLAAYPGHHESDQVRPEGWISALRAGWPEKPAFPSAAVEIYLDVRTNPDQTAAQVEHEFRAFLQQAAADFPGIAIDLDLVADCPAARTDPDHWIVRSCRRGWEARHGRPYPGPAKLSGQTDAAAIAASGLPLARIGYPYPGTWPSDIPQELGEGIGGLGVVHVPDLIGPCQSVIYAIIDSCMRSRDEIARLAGSEQP